MQDRSAAISGIGNICRAPAPRVLPSTSLFIPLIPASRCSPYLVSPPLSSSPAPSRPPVSPISPPLHYPSPALPAPPPAPPGSRSRSAGPQARGLLSRPPSVPERAGSYSSLRLSGATRRRGQPRRLCDRRRVTAVTLSCDG